jgi:hypothetical protein
MSRGNLQLLGGSVCVGAVLLVFTVGVLPIAEALYDYGLWPRLTPEEQVSNRSWTQADAQITDWMTDYLVNNRERLGLSEDRDTWPPLRALRTASAIHAYHMARIVMNVGLLRAIGTGDAHDAHHYASACYADIVVTEDGAFRETLRIIPNSPVTRLSFNDFASQFGLAPTLAAI